MSNRNILFVDNETLAIGDHGVVLSVGALMVAEEDFDKGIDTLLKENTKTWKLDAREQKTKYNRFVSKDVLNWWKDQSDDAKAILAPSADDWSAEDFLDDFIEWTALNGYSRGGNWMEGLILQRGTIDFPMIASLSRDVHGTEEWLYESLNWRKLRDIRSIIDTLNLGAYDAMNKYSVPCKQAMIDYTDGEYDSWWDYLDFMKTEYSLVQHDAASDCVIQFESMRCMGFV